MKFLISLTSLTEGSGERPEILMFVEHLVFSNFSISTFHIAFLIIVKSMLGGHAGIACSSTSNLDMMASSH